MKLYYAPGACSMASHIALNEFGLAHTAEAVDLKTHRTQSGQDFYTINPKGYVPALELNNGDMLTEGVAILSCLSEMKSAGGAVPRAKDTERYRLLEWLVFIATELHKGFGTLFSYKEGPENIVNDAKKKIGKRFDYLDKHLSGRQFLMGDSFTVADAYLFTILSWSTWVAFDLSPWKNLEDYFQRILMRPAVQKTMKEEELIR
jgi:glutathione S-transferase